MAWFHKLLGSKPPRSAVRGLATDFEKDLSWTPDQLATDEAANTEFLGWRGVYTGRGSLGQLSPAIRDLDGRLRAIEKKLAEGE